MIDGYNRPIPIFNRMIAKCERHGWYEPTNVVYFSPPLRCPLCIVLKVLPRIENTCHTHMNVSVHWKDKIRCVDVYNYRMIRELVPERCGITINGKKFMILYDDPPRFHSTIKAFCPDEQTDFEDEVHKDVAKMRYAHEHGFSILRISFEESNEIEYWINKFIHKVVTSTFSVVMCSNPKKYNQLQKDSEYYLREDRKCYFE